MSEKSIEQSALKAFSMVKKPHIITPKSVEEIFIIFNKGYAYEAEKDENALCMFEATVHGRNKETRNYVLVTFKDYHDKAVIIIDRFTKNPEEVIKKLQQIEPSLIFKKDDAGVNYIARIQ